MVVRDSGYSHSTSRVGATQAAAVTLALSHKPGRSSAPAERRCRTLVALALARAAEPPHCAQECDV
jgi:hypothetical protein